MREISGRTKLLCVIGSPVAHSLSPKLHNSFAEQYGADFVYLAFEVTKDTLADFVKSAKTLPIAGFNITMPLKEAILPYLDALDPIAARCGAVNTVVNRDGKLTGYNTDGEGLLASLEGVKYSAPLLLGTGGAAKAVSAAFAAAGVDAPMTSVRTEWDKLGALAAKSDIIINATSLGMLGSEQFKNFEWLNGSDACVYDLVYNPQETELLKAAKTLGLKTVGGTALLQRQAEIAFEKFITTKNS
ncbi:MAG: shikimate dehydrogenase [Oscillospiraceae bacterium]|jgi:shikimate dehydrogenase|nr:shikimate dehydrogenase [Oscillospiraceae bacterium]